MTIRMRLAAVSACALLLSVAAPTATFSADMMSGDAMAGGDAMMSEDQAMAAECLAKAEMETDKAKMEMMVAECHEMYPDAMMEGDAMMAGEGDAMAPAN